jgi:hypothetical protein
MWSRLYILMCCVYLAAVWLGGYGSIGQREKIVQSGMLLGGLAPVMWLDTVTRWGLRSLRTAPLMATVFLRSKRGSTLTGVAVVCLCVWLSPFATQPSPYRYHMSVTLILTLIFLWLQPPCVLVLGASSPPTGRALALVSSALFPFRVVALLDHRKTGYILGSFSPLTDNLRTESDSHWRTTVDHLADHVPLIVLDARTDTPIVVSEVRQILGQPSRLHRTAFIVGAEGEAPALRAHGLSHESAVIRAVREEEIGRALKGWLAARG